MIINTTIKKNENINTKVKNLNDAKKLKHFCQGQISKNPKKLIKIVNIGEEKLHIFQTT